MGWIYLLLGLAIWVGAHLFKRVAPDARARLGSPGKGLMAILLIGSVVLMVMGYRNASGPVFWGPHPALVGINNLLMLVAFWIYSYTTRTAGLPVNGVIGARLRHPQLYGVKTWALAHLLVNGDLVSFVLFGGLLAWAVVEVILINKQDAYTPPAPGPIWQDGVALVIGAVLMGIVSGIHIWLGVWPFS